MSAVGVGAWAVGIMGGSRGKVHTKLATKLTDLSTLVKPQLIVLDAYRTLMRNGPGGGNLADVVIRKTCVAGTNAVAIDAYGCQIMGWKPLDLAVVAEASKRGLGTSGQGYDGGSANGNTSSSGGGVCWTSI